MDTDLISSIEVTVEEACAAEGNIFGYGSWTHHSLLYLAYVEHEMGIDEGAEWVRAKLERSWEKMDPTARELVDNEYEVARTFLDVDDSN
jgi:hypothetical protein